MSENYVSSIINKYGDTDNVKKDSATIRDIIGRQGTSLIIDCLASYCGEFIIKFGLNSEDRNKLVSSIKNELNESISERT